MRNGLLILLVGLVLLVALFAGWWVIDTIMLPADLERVGQ